MMRLWLTGCFFLLLSGCSTLKFHGNNQFLIEKRWVRNTLAQEFLLGRRQHRFSPILTSDTVYVANAVDGIMAYNRNTAQIIWRQNIQNGVEGGAVLQGDSLLFGASDGFFYSLKSSTGEVKWTYPIHSEGLSAPFVKDGVIYFISGHNIVHALNLESGQLIWVYTRRDPSQLSIRGGSQPNVVDDIVYVGFSDGYLVALKKNTGAVIWEVSLNRNKRFRDVDAHPVIDQDRLYISSYDGSLYCLNRFDGKVYWTMEEGGESAVELEGSLLYYATTSGKILALDKLSGKTIWSYKNKAGLSTQPILFKDILVSGEMHGALLFLDKKTGAKVSQFESGWGVAAVPSLDLEKNELYFISGGANLYALRLGWFHDHKNWPWETE